ncbi:universal stress protein [Metapseudomonas lalkuanensis]|uniref:Universal stress protein n=1 Tax=Metapseudomonas lalkuanensis TaxID=2604832 RepID=A0A5J6QR12_9GAMM|nr:universal stress protein [Pseudomonas lalkuanensis]QEY63129.1 universal stress protein [Pseudomonas lalkuanensis]
MSQSQRILLIGHVEQHHSAALQRAAALAMASGSPLHIAVLVEPFVTYGLLSAELREQIRTSMLNEQQRGWSREADRLKEKGITVTFSVVWTDDIREEIHRHVEEMRPSMLVKDIQPEPLLRRAFVTPLDWYLLRECPVPLHLVSDARHPKPQMIVAAVDPTDPEAQIKGLNDQIIIAATGLATQCGAEFALLFVYNNMPAYMVSGEALAAWADIAEELRSAQHQTFVDLAERHRIPQERRHFVVGNPVTGIIGFAEERQADVVVMGRVHRRGLGKLIGSTTESVLYRLPGSMLAIHPHQSGAET